ncbi:MAG: peroxide stress protein YaaA [SAR324 cluster bacterium]|nr:peroxide stress protein YaaA [SAR324 cluster bacterium]
MIVLLSPAKSLDFTRTCPYPTQSLPFFIEGKTLELIEVLKQKTVGQVGELMGLSEKLAELNFARFQAFGYPFPENTAREAAYAFTGDVYQGLDITTLGKAQIQKAQACIRILSGLYGLLKPLDLILPYRLEMGTRLATDRGKNLYDFWAKDIATLINKEKPNFVLNLASGEYFRAVGKKLNSEVISPIFQDEKNGKYKVISFLAKRARGLMARWALQNDITNASQLKDFDFEGYKFSPEGSAPNAPLFKRSERQRLAS